MAIATFSHSVIIEPGIGKKAAVLVAVLAIHLGLLTWALNHMVLPQPETVVPPSVQGILIAPAPPPKPKVVSEPKPLKSAKPKSAPQNQPTPQVQDKPSPIVQAQANDTAKPQDTVVTQTAEPAPAPTTPNTNNAVPVEAPVVPPRTDASQLNNPAPQYPPISRRLGEEGRVLIDVYILPNGTVGEIKLQRSSGYPKLDAAALSAVKNWKYVPARRGNTPIPYWYVQPISFTLNN